MFKSSVLAIGMAILPMTVSADIIHDICIIKTLEGKGVLMRFDYNLLNGEVIAHAISDEDSVVVDARCLSVPDDDDPVDLCFLNSEKFVYDEEFTFIVARHLNYSFVNIIGVENYSIDSEGELEGKLVAVGSCYFHDRR